MRISDFSIQNPVKVVVGVILLCLYGLIALLGVPVQLTPDVSKPTITVQTEWPGANPQEIEKEIVEKQEEELKGVKGMIEFSSECRKGRGEVTLEFAAGTDMSERLVDVANALQQVREYPPDADKPRIRTVNINDSPVAWFSLIPEPPTLDEVETFLRDHADNQALHEDVRLALRDEKVDLAILYRFSKKHPELNTLLAHRLDPGKLRNFAEDVLESAFERVDGVANSNVYGGQEERMEVIFDPGDLARRQITLPDLRDRLAAANQDVSAGDVWDQKSRHDVRILGKFDSIEQVENVVLDKEHQTRVKDVARVRLGYSKPDGVVRQRGVPSLALNVQKEDAANVLEVMEAVKAKTQELNEGVLKTKGLRLIQVYDQTVYITSATRLVRNNIFIGGALAVLVLLLFLRDGRSTLVVALAIPISIIGTFLIVRVLGRSINVISLAGMAFAVGMVVDNAIVVLENIFSHYQRGEAPRTAASRGATEVWGAVLASTLTTLAVFIPVVFVQEQAGQLFRDIAIAISAAVALSMLVSLTVIPTAASRLLRRREGSESNRENAEQRTTRKSGRFTRAIVWLTERLQAGQISNGAIIGCCVVFFLGAVCLAPVTLTHYSWWRYLVPVPALWGVALAVVATAVFVPLAFWARRLAFVLTMIVLAFGLSARLMPGTEYLPEGNRNLIVGRLQPPPGYNLERMIHIGEKVESRLRRYWEALPDPVTGESFNGPAIDSFFLVARGDQMFMGARAVEDHRAHELVDILRQATVGFPGVISFASQSSLFERGLSGGRTIDVEISGDDLAKLIGLGRRVLEDVQEILPPDTTKTSFRPIPSLELSSPELQIRRNLAKAAEREVSTADLGFTVNALVDGAYSGDYWHKGDKIDLVLTAPLNLSERVQDVAELPLATRTGETVPLRAVAEVKNGTGPDRVVRIDRQRAITIQVKPGEAIALEDATRRINEEVLGPLREEGLLEGGRYQIRLGGTADELKQMRGALGGSMLLAVVITYLLIAALYESFLFPLVIMVSVPMAAVGGFAGLQFLNLFTIQKLDTLTMLGFIILVGTTVNNAILIVNQALVNIRRYGMEHRAAVTDSVRGRVRPIFMSTLTTVLGMLPLVLYPGAGSELYRGLGSVVLGGLLVSTFFTLVLAPMLFSLAYETQQKLRAKLGRETAELEGEPPEWEEPMPEVPVTISGNGEPVLPGDGETPAIVNRPR